MGFLKTLADPGEIAAGRANDPFFGGAAAVAAKDAAALQAQATAAGLAETRRQFDVSQEQLAPFREAGIGALGQQQALLGLSGQEAQQAAFAGLEESPGQRFIRDRQERSLLRNASATGGLGGGNVLTALQEQATGFAQQDIQNQFGRLGQLAGQGQATATGSAQLGGQQASNVAGLLGQQGAARASGVLGAQQAQAQGTQNVLQLAGLAAAAFSDERLKVGKVEVGRDDVGGMYRFKYIWSDIEYLGRMAQELLITRPDAVSMHESGFLQVSEEFAPEVI